MIKTQDIGPMRQRVEWLQQVTTRDHNNQQIRTPTTVGTFWCKVEPQGGAETVVDGVILQPISDAKITMRYVTSNGVTIKPADQFTIDGVTYNVTNVNDIELRHRYLSITVKSVDT